MVTPSVRGRPTLVASITKACLILIAQLPRFHGHPTSHEAAKRSSVFEPSTEEHFPAEPPDSADFWANVIIALVLVVLGGVFAGLTLALMGQDEIYLQVIEQSGEPKEQRDARSVLKLLKRGKHWVLVTLLLSNVITNETLPIVLDRSLGGGWAAVVISTVLIVIFGEVIPQSVCVRYGLAVGARFSPLVLALMYTTYPISYPIALLLDRILGEDHGTIYKKAGLKTLVTLHKTLGPTPADRLNQDEVTIITAVLDLKDKPVEAIMTPINDVFCMSADTILDEPTTDAILRSGYSRIPIYAPGEPTNFVGMLLVKILITYDPEDCMKVSDFSLATLPETAPETSCLDIVNFFQEGKSHMVLVSEHPGENYGALGVVTLEDVIEELIGEEIVDESDVYIDVHKAIRRINPSPLIRRSISSAQARTDFAKSVNKLENVQLGSENGEIYVKGTNKDGSEARETIGKKMPSGQISISSAISPDVLQHLKHLGPSNLASNPKKTQSKTVKIKPGSSMPSSSAADSNTGTNAGHERPPTSGYGATDENPALTETTGVNANALLDEEEYNKKYRPTHLSVSPTDRGRTATSSGPYIQSGDISPGGTRRTARSGTLMESVRNTNGIPKTVIETTSSDDNDDPSRPSSRDSRYSRRRRQKPDEERPLIEDEASGSE